jgi:hypothetical protein
MPAAGVTYKLDPTHTNVIASWNHFGFSNPSANFGGVEGTPGLRRRRRRAFKRAGDLAAVGMDGFVPKSTSTCAAPISFDAAASRKPASAAPGRRWPPASCASPAT